AVTPSKFSLKTVTGPQVWVGVAVAVAVAVAVGVGGGVPVAVGVGVGTGMHSPRRIETVFDVSLATAKSCLPSPLKSPIATERGPMPTLTLVEPLKLPIPSPDRISAVSEQYLAPDLSTFRVGFN